jgi:hypothetical protein
MERIVAPDCEESDADLSQRLYSGLSASQLPTLFPGLSAEDLMSAPFFFFTNGHHLSPTVDELYHRLNRVSMC